MAFVLGEGLDTTFGGDNKNSFGDGWSDNFLKIKGALPEDMIDSLSGVIAVQIGAEEGINTKGQAAGVGGEINNLSMQNGMSKEGTNAGIGF